LTWKFERVKSVQVSNKVWFNSDSESLRDEIDPTLDRESSIGIGIWKRKSVVSAWGSCVGKNSSSVLEKSFNCEISLILLYSG